MGGIIIGRHNWWEAQLVGGTIGGRHNYLEA